MRQADSLEQKRRRLLTAALPLAAGLGFGSALLEEAERAARLPAGEAGLLFPEGASALIGFWRAQLDAALTREAGRLARLKGTQARVEEAIFWRLQAEQPHRAAARAAAAWLSLPPHWPHAARHLYATSDAIWRSVRDRSVDASFYSKRLIVSGLYGAVHLFWLEDDSPKQAETRAFLKRRLDGLAVLGELRARTAPWQERGEACVQRLAAWRYGGRARPAGKSKAG